MTTYYIDTNIVISYIDESDPYHKRVFDFINKLRNDRVVSELVLIELVSVYSRAGFEEPLPLALYSVKKIKADVIEIDFNEVIRTALKYAYELKLRTLDLLHLVASKLIGCERFITLDKEIIKRSKVVSDVLGIEIVSIE